LWKDDLKFLQKSFNQALDTRVHGFASDFNNLYKARLEEIAALKRFGSNGVPFDHVGTSTGFRFNVQPTTG